MKINSYSCQILKKFGRPRQSSEKYSNIKLSMKICLVEAELTHRHDETNSHFSQLLKTPKKKLWGQQKVQKVFSM
jgi:hypothetical protein